MAKKYYWLKLYKDFFQRREIKKLRRIAGGDTFTIIYLKLLLYSTQYGGELQYEGTESTLARELALEIEEYHENVQMVLSYMLDKNLAVRINETTLCLVDAATSSGGETDG